MRFKSKDVAEALGISQATVSLVMNDRPGVGAGTRKKVQLYIEQLEQSCSSRSKVESFACRGTVLMLYYIKHGIIMKRKESISRPLFSDEVEEIVNQEGYHFLYEEFYEKEEDLEEAFARWKFKGVKGIYIMAAEMKRGDIYPFQKLEIPVVAGDNLFYDLGMDSFLIDNKDGISRGVDYLVDKGHSHIIYLAENTDIFNFTERREAFIREMERRECGDGHHRIIHLGSSVEEVYDRMNCRLNGGLRKVTAFVLESAVISLGVCKALMEHNIKVPKEISLVGFDALPEYSIPGQNLTLIKGTHTKRHKAAVRHLLQHLDSGGREDEMVRVYYRTRILEGDSVFDKTKYIYH